MRNYKRIVLFAVAAALLGVLAYRLGRPPSVAHSTDDASEKKVAEQGVVRDAWQDIVGSRATRSPSSPVISGGESGHSSLPDLPLGPFGANIDDLKRRAGTGDSSAARALAEGYRHCQFFQPPQDQAELEKRAEDNTVNQLGLVDEVVDQIKEQAAGKGVEIGKIPEIAPLPVYQAQLKAETDLAETCRGVNVADAQKWADWYARAAKLGDVDAELGYWQVAFSQADAVSLNELAQQKDAAATYLQRALSRGDARALAAIGAVLETGYYANPDPFFAHAYYFAASRMPAADISTLPWIGSGFLTRLVASNDTQTYFERALQRTANMLDARQLAESEQIGAALFAQCCKQGRR